MYAAVILDLSACEECCVVAYRTSQDDVCTSLMVCNSFGAALDGNILQSDFYRYLKVDFAVISVKMHIRHVGINNFYVIAASDHCYLIWSYDMQKPLFTSGSIKICFNIKLFIVHF